MRLILSVEFETRLALAGESLLWQVEIVRHDVAILEIFKASIFTAEVATLDLEVAGWTPVMEHAFKRNAKE